MSNDHLPRSSHFPTGNADSAGMVGGDEVTVSTKASTRPTKRPVRPEKSIDEQLVDQTKTQIRALVQEIDELAKTDCSREVFFEGFLTRTTSALASIGGAIWTAADDDSLQLQYHINLKKTGLVDNESAQLQHHKLLHRLIEKGEPELIRPESTAADQSGNPTDYLLVIAPLKVNNRVTGLVEIFQRPGAGPTTQRGYQRFVMQMSEIASDFLANEKIRSFHEQQQIWQQFEQFIQLVHQGLDTNQTAYTLANESRRLTDCDRISVALGDRRRCQVKAVSGLDSIERRAEQVKSLGDLATAVVKTGRPLWYNGDSESLPPQLDSRLQTYVDRSHTKMIAILPLFDQGEEIDSAESGPPPQVIGALIVEQLKDSRISQSLRNRVEVVVKHGQMALANSREHNQIFLMPLWKALGKLTSLFQAGKRAKTLTVLLLLGCVAAFLSWFPYEFGLGANGRLIPETQCEVFAQTSGRLKELHVSDTGDTLVKQNQVLGVMTNSDIELAISTLQGQIAEANSQIVAASQRLSAGGMDVDERIELESRLSRDRQTKKSLTNELNIQLEERELLKVVSPMSGRVVNWNVRQNLLNRPVELGQNLMTIVPPDAIWQLELQMPERRLAHLFRAMEEASEDAPLRVTFGLVSNPGVEYTGTVISVDRKLDVYTDDGNAALVRVAFDNSKISEELLRSETRVTAKVHCGERSIGYVMFHELIETVQSKLMFWF